MSLMRAAAFNRHNVAQFSLSLRWFHPNSGVRRAIGIFFDGGLFLNHIDSYYLNCREKASDVKSDSCYPRRLVVASHSSQQRNGRKTQIVGFSPQCQGQDNCSSKSLPLPRL